MSQREKEEKLQKSLQIWFETGATGNKTGRAGNMTSRGRTFKNLLIETIMVTAKKNSFEACNRFDLVPKTELYTKVKGQKLDLRTQKDRYQYIWQLIDEGFFINSTITELAEYLKDMKHKPGAVEKRNFGTTGFCDMLDELRTGADFPAKFIMICTINAQKMNGKRDNCATDIAETIKFLKLIQTEEPDPLQAEEEKKEE